MECLFVENKNVEKVENSYIERVKVRMPEQSQYFGYFFYVATSFVVKTGSCTLILKGNDTYLYELIKEEREQGKRYKRYKLTFEELCAEFLEMQKELNPDYFPKAFAVFNEYEYSKSGVELEREETFSIGGLRDKWFYLDFYTRKRVSAPNFKIIKENLTEQDVVLINTYLKRLKEFIRHYELIETALVKIKNDFYEFNDYQDLWDIKRIFAKNLEKAKKSDLDEIERIKESLRHYKGE